jgi:hypothetical protein
VPEDVGSGKTDPKALPSIKRIGFFAFGSNDKSDPVGSLEIELEKKPESQLKDSLIVLPEAFNSGADYKTSVEPRIPATDVLRQLAKLSRDYGIVFIAGLLHAEKQYNSAYLVDADLGPTQRRWLCHKTCDDGQGYNPCVDDPINGGNPAHWKGAYVGALICVDTQRWSLTMENRLKDCKCGDPSVLCIAARVCTASTLFSSDRWMGPEGPYRVVADSGVQSFITNRQGNKVVRSDEGQNALCVKTWAELDAIKTRS